LSRRVLNISREGDSTASLGSLGQGSVTLRGKKFFLVLPVVLCKPSVVHRIHDPSVEPPVGCDLCGFYVLHISILV